MTTLVFDIVQSSLTRVQDAVSQKKLPLTESETLELLTGGHISLDQVDRLRKYLDTILSRGVERTLLVGVLDRALDLLDTATVALDPLPNIEEQAPAIAARYEEDLAKLRKAREDVGLLKAKVESMRTWLNAPRSPIDLAALPVTEEDIQHGNYKTLDEMLPGL